MKKQIAGMLTALLFLAVAGAHGQENDREPATVQVDMDALLSEYREFGLPLPPPEAPLIRYATGRSIDPASGAETQLYAPAFLLHPESEDSPACILSGTQRKFMEEWEDEVERVKPSITSFNDFHVRFQDIFDMSSGLAFSIQCQSRGWKEMARQAFDLHERQDIGDTFGFFQRPSALPPMQSLHFLAWTHYAGEMGRPGADRKTASKYLHILHDTEPLLQGECFQKFLQRVEASIQPLRGEPGTIDALIDALLNEENSSGTWEIEKASEAYRALVEAGFDAIPALIDHLDDIRLTCTLAGGMMKDPRRIQSVGAVASEILQCYAGDEITLSWSRAAQSFVANHGDVQSWWNKAQAIGEEAYLYDRAIKYNSAVTDNHVIFHAFAHRYPERLLQLFDAALQRKSNKGTWSLMREIRDCPLPAERKIKALKLASDSGDTIFRYLGIRYLVEMNADGANDLLIRELDAIPAHSNAHATWISPEERWSHVVMCTENPDVWNALLRAAKRTDVALRMKLMNSLNYSYVKDLARAQRLHFLSLFLDDTAMWVKDATEAHAEFRFINIEVRNFAAMQMASILKMKTGKPDDRWSPEQWSEYRTTVQNTYQIGLKSN